jgi:hypothetical protein
MKPTDKSLIAFYKEIDLTGKEVARHYRFPGDEIVTIEHPVTLIVSDNGHRVVDATGDSHYVPYGWIHLWWENTPGREEGKGFLCQEGYDLDEPEVVATADEPENPGLDRLGYFESVLADSRSRGKDVFLTWEDSTGQARSVALTDQDLVTTVVAPGNVTAEGLQDEFALLCRKAEANRCRLQLRQSHGSPHILPIEKTDCIEVITKP